MYNKIEWTTGTASGGDFWGLGGTPAQVWNKIMIEILIFIKICVLMHIEYRYSFKGAWLQYEIYSRKSC